MENKQTGWVPDFPDVKDYTLRSKQVHKALQPIQATQVIGSLESQKESVLELLDQIVKTTNKPEVNSIYKKIQEGIGNEVRLLEAKLLEQNEQSYRGDNEKLAKILDIERIPSKVFDVIVKRLFKEFGSQLVELKEDKKGSILIKVVYPIVKVIAQILTPIGGHGNLPKAVTDKGIKYFKSLLEPESKSYVEPDSNKFLENKLESLFQEIKELKKATESNHNSSNSSSQSISSWKSNHKYFEYLACSAMLKAKEQLIAMKALQELDKITVESFDSTDSTDSKIFEILEKIDNDLKEDFNNVLKDEKLPFQKALEFEGSDDYVNIQSFEWEPGKPVTVEFWTKVNQEEVESGGLAFTAVDEKSLSSDGDGSLLPPLFEVSVSSGDIGLQWRYLNQLDYWLFADYSPYLNQWTHVALVVGENPDNYMSIYLNGVLVEQCSMSNKDDGTQKNPSEPITATLRIGGSNGESYKGQIAEFRIWNKPRTQKEIRDNMFLPKDSEEKPTNYWPLDEVTDDGVVNNKSNPNNKGVLSEGTKQKIVPIEESLLKKWIIKEEKNKFEKLVYKKQTRFDIIPPQKDTARGKGGNKTNCLQFLILKKHLEKITATVQNDDEIVGLAILPDFIDLSLWCSEIEDQGSLNSCTASAAIALMEYFQKKSFGKYIDGSRLFLYKATRNLMQIEGNVGTSIRNTMKAMALFGVPPEEYWPYDEAKVNVEPAPFCYAFAQSYQALKYFRLDPAGITNEVLLAQIKAILVSGFPCVFGFTLYSSIYDDSNPKGHIPYPHQRDKAEGGHSVVAVGYDDYKVIKNADDEETIGALLIRNSWGSRWGEGGYGWLPYDYVLKGLTADWWSLLSSEWFDTEQFGLGGKDWTDNVGTPEAPGQPKPKPSPSAGNKR
jgi:C1A family cysteine protease